MSNFLYVSREQNFYKFISSSEIYIKKKGNMCLISNLFTFLIPHQEKHSEVCLIYESEFALSVSKGTFC